MRVIIVGLAALALSGCVYPQYVNDDYRYIPLVNFAYENHSYRIFDKPSAGKLIITPSLATAMTFVRRTQSGLVHVYRETAGVEPHVPFGGVKASSNMQREQGKAARAFFTTTKTVYLRTT